MTHDSTWSPYVCSDCGEVTQASACPPYCPVCEDTTELHSVDDLESVYLDEDGAPRTGTESLSKSGR